MGFKCGIVGLPNVGKSTLFNALTASKNAQAANFPFCTIDPNIGVVDVPDERLDQLSKLSNSKKKIFTNITFVDIAGLVKGASKGEGLGNKFLSHIREVDAIIHLVRCFDSSEVTHVSSEINPLNDLETINSNQIKSTLSFYNFVSTFDFLEKNKVMGGNSYISNESKLTFNENSSFSFKTRKNKEKDLTEYYNLIYQYRNDCLVAGIEYKKDFYSDGSLKPDEQLFFSITIMPFGKVNTPDIKQ